MHGARKESRSVVVTLDDEYGKHVKHVFVEVPVVVVSYTYGADADGMRGERREEIIPDMAEAHIPSRFFLGLTDAQLQDVLTIAEKMILHSFDHC